MALGKLKTNPHTCFGFKCGKNTFQTGFEKCTSQTRVEKGLTAKWHLGN